MDIEADFLVNPLSYILGTLSLFAFLIVARNEAAVWLNKLLAGRRRDGLNAFAERSGTRTVNDISTILGLVYLGFVFSAGLYIARARIDQLQADIHFNLVMPVFFVYYILPGGLLGILSGIWIDAASGECRGDTPGRLFTGILVYILFITLVELLQLHLLLFLCGPLVALLVYKFSPALATGSP